MDLKKIFCVIVSYHSDHSSLNERIFNLSRDFTVVVVSNGDTDIIRREFKTTIDSTYCKKIALNDNYGIGFAQNVGIAYAQESAAEYVLLLDDDSDIENISVVNLLKCYSELKDEGKCIAAMCAAPVDFETGNSIVHRLERNNKYTDIRDLMSSGTLIPLDSFGIIGMMNESLFIDCVDYEWGWRCANSNMRLIVANESKIRHKLGEDKIYILPSVFIRLPSPIRHYYQFRNVINIILFGNSPIRWKVKNSIYLPIKFVFYIIYSDMKILRLKYMIRGIADGILGRMGKFK